MRIILILFVIFFTLKTHAQSSDIIILKKKNKTIKIFFKGSNIEFLTTRGAYRNAVIKNIKNDSVFIQEFIINRIPTTLGFFIIDTAGSFSYAYNYKEIAHFGQENKKFDVGGSGATLLGGGVLLSVASAVVYIADKKTFSPTLLAAGAGLATIGYFMSKAAGKGITIGKKGYRLKYMNSNVSQK